MKTSHNSPEQALNPISPSAAAFDLVLFLGTMILIRMVSIPNVPFLVNGLINSIAVLAVATWLLYRRGQTWKSLGLTRPKNMVRMLVSVPIILGSVIICIMIYQTFIHDLITTAAGSDLEPKGKDTRFEGIQGNVPYFLITILVVWVESFFEELQDRGFSLTRFEALFSKIPWSVVLGVIAQAAIFGYRHAPSHGIAGAITVLIIGLVFGVAYVLSGRNLWALIIAHCFLNSMSMVERFFEGG